ncbi:MAG: pseudouridine synthase [Bacteroidota bacterium]
MARYRYFLIYKPYQVLSQFTDPVGGKRTLGELYDFPRDVYPVGRLDEDSEGLLLLTNDPQQNQYWLGQNIEKEYYAQVEGIPPETALAQLRSGVDIRVRKKIHRTLPAEAQILPASPVLPARIPPIRYRKNVPDTWLTLTLREGKNRQVRRMTAKVGFPTLRLVRWRMGAHTAAGLAAGEILELAHF